MASNIKNTKRLEPSFLAVLGYICCFPVWTAFYLFTPAGENSCLPVSTLTMVTLFFFILSGFQQGMRFLAKGMFNPLWKSLGAHHQEKLVHQLCDIVIRTCQLVLILWWWGQSLVNVTASLDTVRCPQQAVAMMLGVQLFHAMMLHELLTMKGINKGLVVHHVVVIFSLLALTEPAIKTHISTTSDVYYYTVWLWITIGGQCMAVVSPAFIYYHLYPNLVFGQFTCYLWISVSKTLIISTCFMGMPFFVIYSNFDKMTPLTLGVISTIVSVNLLGEFSVLRINWSICGRKFRVWRNTLEYAKQKRMS